MSKGFPIATLILLFTVVACKKDNPEPAPPLSLGGVLCGGIELAGGSATNVSTTSPIIITFGAIVDATTATTTNITLKQGASLVSIGVSASISTVTVTPTNELSMGLVYTLTISSGVKSDKGVSAENITISFTTQPPPALTLTSIKSGTIELNGVTPATNVSIALPVIAIFSTNVDATTATASNITLKKETTSVAITIAVSGSTITITPTNALSYNSNYALSITNSIKSDKGAVLTNSINLSFSTAEPSKVFISSVVATPTDSESITLKNNSGSTIDISGWTLGDTNDPTSYKIPAGTILTQGSIKVFPHTTLGFQINDSGEVLYLKNGTTEIDVWRN